MAKGAKPEWHKDIPATKMAPGAKQKAYRAEHTTQV